MLRSVVIISTIILVLCFSVTTWSAELNFVEASTFKGWLKEKKPMILADIQKVPGFKTHHFYGAVGTNAYPAKTDQEKNKLDVILQMHEKTGMDVVIIGPRGGASSKRTAKHLIEKGIPAEKVFILKGGVNKWPDREMLLNVAGGCA